MTNDAYEKCTKECERVATCTICHRTKPPIGRDVAAAAAGGFCQHECPGYRLGEQSGHLWPGELHEVKP